MPTAAYLWRLVVPSASQKLLLPEPCLRLQVEMYADPVARGGVLEPEGIVEIKFRTPVLLKAVHLLSYP